MGLPLNPASFRSASPSIRMPSLITWSTWRRSPISPRGSPSTSSRSASLPTVIDPVRLSTLTLRAGAMVAVASASAGGQAALHVELELAHQLHAVAVGSGDDRHAGAAQLGHISTMWSDARRASARVPPGNRDRPPIEPALGRRRQSPDIRRIGRRQGAGIGEQHALDHDEGRVERDFLRPPCADHRLHRLGVEIDVLEIFARAKDRIVVFDLATTSSGIACIVAK